MNTIQDTTQNPKLRLIAIKKKIVTATTTTHTIPKTKPFLKIRRKKRLLKKEVQTETMVLGL